MTSIANVTALTASGSYKAGATVTLAVDFDGAVLVDTTGGVPTLSLSSGGAATYMGGSGSSTLAFTYTVGGGETSADLDYASTSALEQTAQAIGYPGAIQVRAGAGVGPAAFTLDFGDGAAAFDPAAAAARVDAALQAALAAEGLHAEPLIPGSES